MNNFSLHLPTKIVFGKDSQLEVGNLIKSYTNKKVLLHYGGGSIKKSGLYDQVVSSLNDAGIEFIELGGVKPNPRLDLANEGAALCKKENVGFILAVGGGSVIDSAKSIGIGACYDGDIWDFYDGISSAKETLPVATILTIPAAGSEMSPSCVITNEETKRKYGYTNEIMRPVFSILNPDLCKTLPKNQMANGVSDMLAHVMERYFTDTPHVDTTDRLCESVMRCIIENGKQLYVDYQSYDLWAEIVLCGTYAHNDILGVGRDESWVSHSLEHEISAIYDIPHGQGLAIVFPAWIRHVADKNPSRFVQFATRVFNIELPLEDPSAIIEEGVKRLEEFYLSLDLPTRLNQIDIDSSNIETMSQAISKTGVISYDDALSVYNLSLK